MDWVAKHKRIHVLPFLGATALSAGLSGCLLSEPDVGPQVSERCINEDSDPNTDIDYQRDIVDKIFSEEPTACFECHRPDAPNPVGFEVGGLDLSSYQTLRQGGAISGSSVVIPGNPCESILLQKIRDGVPFGGRMPLSGAPYLTDEEIQNIHDWIAEGALGDS